MWCSRWAQSPRPTARSRLLTPSRACRKIDGELHAKSFIRRLEPRFLEPDRSRLTELRSLVHGISSADSAWARLAASGFLPPEFVDSQKRFFIARGGDRLSHPPTVEACLLFACDPDGLLRAENFARTASAHLALWRSDPEPQRARSMPIVWRIRGAARAADRDGPSRIDLAGAESAAKGAVRLARWSSPEERPELRFRPAAMIATAAAAWKEATLLRGVIRGSDTLPVPASVEGKSIEELPDPFEPLYQLYLLGYAVRRIDSESIALFAPEAPRLDVIGRRKWRAVTDGSARDLRRAALEADLEAIAEMLEDGVDPNLATEGGETAVHATVRSRLENSTQALRLLAQGAARLDLIDEQGLAPIHLAALLGKTGKIKTLVELGVAVDSKSHDGRRPLHFAVEGGHEDAVKTLLDLGASPNDPDEAGRAPLHCLHSRISRPGLYRRLLGAGADPDARTLSGWTALHEVAGARWGGGEGEMLGLLLHAGAKQHRELSGWTPADLARYRNHRETADQLAVVPVIESPQTLDDPRNELLERAIWRDPNDRDPWLVYGDWLQSRGDPRGEIIAIDVAYELAHGAERARLKRERTWLYLGNQAYLAAGLEPLRSARGLSTAPSERWRRGFLDALAIDDPPPPPLITAAPRLPACRFLRTLAVYVGSGVQRFVDAMLEIDQWASLRTLRFSGVWRPFSGAPALALRLPNLEALDIAGSAVRDLELSWTGLQRLRLRPGPVPLLGPLGLRLRLDLPDLLLLDLDVRTEEEIHGLRAVLETPPPKLSSLRLVQSTPEVIAAVAEHLPPQLASLELVHPNLGALAELERRADLIERLDLRLNLRDDRVMGAERVRRLKERLPRLKLCR